MKFLSAILSGFLLGLIIWIGGCTSSQKIQSNPLLGKQPENRISIMAYNLENFFDEIHDKDRVDYTFLPLSQKSTAEVKNYCSTQKGFYKVECESLNWDSAVVQKKIDHIAQGILQVYGQGPDILIVEEVENIRILNRLKDEGLKSKGYQTSILIEGEDMRGIDVGLLSRFPLAGKAELHKVVYSATTEPGRERYGTRGVLQVPLKMPNGKTLYVFGVHFPSQSNPTSERQDAMNTLLKAIHALPAGSTWVVGGDWNITYRENQETEIFDKGIGAEGLVSHKVGCKQCEGTHNYRGVWDFLDILVFSKNLESKNDFGYVLDTKSIQTPRYATIQTDLNGRPARFDAKSDRGISDHLPIYGELIVAP